MVVVAFVLILCATGCMVLYLRREVDRAVAKLTADSEARAKLLDDQQKVLYKQGKAAIKREAAMRGAADRAVGRANDVVAKHREAHLQVQQILLAPKIQAVLNEETDRGR